MYYFIKGEDFISYNFIKNFSILINKLNQFIILCYYCQVLVSMLPFIGILIGIVLYLQIILEKIPFA